MEYCTECNELIAKLQDGPCKQALIENNAQKIADWGATVSIKKYEDFLEAGYACFQYTNHIRINPDLGGWSACQFNCVDGGVYDHNRYSRMLSVMIEQIQKRAQEEACEGCKKFCEWLCKYAETYGKSLLKFDYRSRLRFYNGVMLNVLKNVVDKKIKFDSEMLPVETIWLPPESNHSHTFGNFEPSPNPKIEPVPFMTRESRTKDSLKGDDACVVCSPLYGAISVKKIMDEWGLSEKMATVYYMKYPILSGDLYYQRDVDIRNDAPKLTFYSHSIGDGKPCLNSAVLSPKLYKDYAEAYEKTRYAISAKIFKTHCPECKKMLTGCMQLIDLPPKEANIDTHKARIQFTVQIGDLVETIGTLESMHNVKMYLTAGYILRSNHAYQCECCDAENNITVILNRTPITLPFYDFQNALVMLITSIDPKNRDPKQIARVVGLYSSVASKKVGDGMIQVIRQICEAIARKDYLSGVVDNFLGKIAPMIIAPHGKDLPKFGAILTKNINYRELTYTQGPAAGQLLQEPTQPPDLINPPPEESDDTDLPISPIYSPYDENTEWENITELDNNDTFFSSRSRPSSSSDGSSDEDLLDDEDEEFHPAVDTGLPIFDSNKHRIILVLKDLHINVIEEKGVIKV